MELLIDQLDLNVCMLLLFMLLLFWIFFVSLCEYEELDS